MATQTERHSLDGTWSFAMDPKEEGESAGWQSGKGDFASSIRVPGSWQSQGVGHTTRTDSRRTLSTYESFFPEMDPALTATRGEYAGVGWYRRDITVPEGWRGRQVWLCMDSVHPACTVWIDGHPVGVHDKGPLEPCRMRITGSVRPGATHTLVVRVSEELRLLQGVVKWPYWSGIYRSAYLEATADVWLEDLYARGDVRDGQVALSAELGWASPRPGLRLSVSVADPAGKSVTSEAAFSGSIATLTLQLPSHELWSPGRPILYTCAAEITDGKEVVARRKTRFGFREIRREGKRILLNGEPLFIRGTGFGGPMGLPGPEPAPRDYYARLVRRIKEYGFNYLRWHTYSCESDLLEEADEQGLLLQSELFSNFFETPEERRLTERQLVLMVRRNRNHPSVAAWCMGNEHDSSEPLFREFRDRLCRTARELGPGVLVMDSDGVADNCLGGHDCSDLISAGLGIGVGGVLDLSPAVREKTAKQNLPYAIHEFGYPESFPDVRDLPRYAGGTRPFWLEHTLSAAKKAGAEELLPRYVESSRRIQLRVHAKAIEDARKVDDLAGYNNWGFHDFLHESTGLVDLFFRDKGMTAEEFRKSNGETVLLCTPLLDRYTLGAGQPLPFRLACSSHANRPMRGARVTWRLSAGGKELDRGEATVDIGAFGTTVLGDLEARTTDAAKPYSLELHASIVGSEVTNTWRFWAFPAVTPHRPSASVSVFKDPWPTLLRMRERYPWFRGVTEAALWDLEPGGLLIAPIVTNAVSSYLGRGGRVLLLPVYYLSSGTGLPSLGSSFAGFPSFAGPRGGQGTIVTSHPALADFPHEGWCDYQFFDLIAGERVPHVCAPFHLGAPGAYWLDKWPVKIEPIIRSVPTWKNLDNRAYLFEARVGDGRLLATTMRLFETAETRPEGAYLLDALIRYADSAEFRPRAAVTLEQFDELRSPVAFINE